MHNTSVVLDKHYLYVGKLIAISLTQGGSGPACFCQWVYDYLTLAFDGVEVAVNDITDTAVQDKLKQVSAYGCMHMCAYSSVHVCLV